MRGNPSPGLASLDHPLPQGERGFWRLVEAGGDATRIGRVPLPSSLAGADAKAVDARLPSPLAGEGGAQRRMRGALQPQARCARVPISERSAKVTVLPRPSPVRTAQVSRVGEVCLAGRLTAFARSLRRDMTDAERRLWSILRSRRFSGVKFRRQVPIGPYIADFLCYEARLIMEADGGQHAESPRDHRRDAWLMAAGFRILRFWNHEILADRMMVEDTIHAVLFPAKGPDPS